MDTQTQVERLIELAIVQRTELRQLVEQLPQLRDHLNAEIERTFEEVEPQIRVELEEFCRARATDEHAKTGAALAAKVDELSKKLEATTSAKYSVLLAERAHNVELERIATEQVAQAANQIPQQVKAIVADELSRFPRAGEIDQLRKEFATPAGLNPRGKWQSGQTYQRLDVVSYNGNSYIANATTTEKPSVTSSAWTINAARGVGGGGPSSLNELTQTPTDGSVLIGSGSSWVTSTLTAGTGISIANAAGSITINATDGNITLDDGTAAAPSLNFTNDTDTGLYLDAANTLGIATGGAGTVLFSSSAGIGKIKAHGTRVLALEAGTGNTNITLTPSGTGVLAVSGAATISSTTASTGVGFGALQVAGGAYFGAASVFNTTLTANGSPATGAVSIKQTEGGVGLYLQRGTNSGGGTGFLIKALDATPGATVFSVGTLGQTVMGALTINAGSPSGNALLTAGDSASVNNVYSAYSFDNYYTTGGVGSMMQVRGKTDASAGRFTALEVCPTINQGSTNGFSILRVSPYLSATGSGTKLLFDVGTNTLANGSGTHTSLVSVDSTGVATFSGAVAIGNTVNTVSPTSPNRTVTMVVNGVTLYIAAKTTND